MTSYRFFSRWRPAATLYLLWIILDHPPSAIVGLKLVLKFGLDRIYIFGDIAIFIFRRFGLHYRLFLGVWGTYFPKMTSPIVLTLKSTSLRGNRFSGSTWARFREKKTGEDRPGQSNKKLRYCEEHSASVVFSWCTLWHFSGENLLMANQSLLRN